MNKKYTKRALFASVMALILCCAMLVGTTMAWFTDTASTAGSKIEAGTLDVDLQVWKDGAWKSVADDKTPLFAYENWEPGYTQYQFLKVVNKGSLALKWKAMLVAEAELSSLADVIDVYVQEGEAVPANRADFENWTYVGTLTDFVNKLEETTVGFIAANETRDAYEAMGIAFKMQETAGNDYQGMDLGGAFDICITATQYTEESDSFDNKYDAEAEFAEGVLGGNGMAKVNDGGVVHVTEELNLGDAGNYALITKNNGVTQIDAKITSGGGGVAAVSGAKVSVNADIYVDSASTSGRYIVYAVGEGTEVTINSGNFSWDKNNNQKRAYIYTEAGATVYVNGGTFDKASTRDGYTAGILGTGNVIITGGTFGFDPTNWVAEGYQAVKDGSTWTVSAK